ncbi:hypothetical protein IWX46DRAFT_624936 [Phyllosticta citricarpa]|uniref:Uncharacterized protein n=1 Tax=Phyllosticta citricarpa TaxID=55181 RepID=A0ABR1MNA9_9PEZI
MKRHPKPDRLIKHHFFPPSPTISKTPKPSSFKHSKMHPPNRPLALLILLIFLTTLALSPTTTTAHPLRHHYYRHGHVALHPATHASIHSHSHKSHEYHKGQHHAHDNPRITHRRLAATRMEKALVERTRLHAPAVQLPKPRPRKHTILPSFRRVWEWGRGRVNRGYREQERQWQRSREKRLAGNVER